jgi:hypothetical protein
MMTSLLEERAEDCVVRMCLAGQGHHGKIHRALIEGGHVSQRSWGSGWPASKVIRRCLDAGKIERAFRGFYVAKCPHCGEAILNVMGAEH